MKGTTKKLENKKKSVDPILKTMDVGDIEVYPTTRAHVVRPAITRLQNTFPSKRWSTEKRGDLLLVTRES